jgi:hypothetical protein
VYSSADHALTKRDGDLFLVVAQAENVPLHRIVHIGDDLCEHLRLKVSSFHHRPRRAYHRYLRSADGALTEAGRFVRRRARAAKATTPFDDNATLFGRHVFGPIVTQFCLPIWLYAWHRLKRTITRPTEAELRCLEIGGRSIDFGRSDVRQIFAPEKNRTFRRKLMSLKTQMWREGAIAREFPFLKRSLLPC